jgi:hypothetical protein
VARVPREKDQSQVCCFRRHGVRRVRSALHGNVGRGFHCASAAPKPLWSIGGYDLPVVVFAVTGLVLVWLGWNALGVLSRDQMRRRTPADAGSKAQRSRDGMAPETA